MVPWEDYDSSDEDMWEPSDERRTEASLLMVITQYLPCTECTAVAAILRRMSETPTTTTSQKSIAIHLLFVLQYASHLYRNTPPICIAIRLPFVSQYFWENLGGCGHRDAPQIRLRMQMQMLARSENSLTQSASGDSTEGSTILLGSCGSPALSSCNKMRLFYLKLAPP